MRCSCYTLVHTAFVVVVVVAVAAAVVVVTMMRLAIVSPTDRERETIIKAHVFRNLVARRNVAHRSNCSKLAAPALVSGPVIDVPACLPVLSAVHGGLLLFQYSDSHCVSRCERSDCIEEPLISLYHNGVF